MARERLKRLTPTKARRAVEAILTCLECDDLEGSERMALEDARAALDPYLED